MLLKELIYLYMYMKLDRLLINCTARQCSPLRRKFMMCTIIQLALSILMKDLVIGKHQKAPNFSAFH